MHRFIHRLLTLALFLSLSAFAQVSFQLSPVAHQQFTDINGKPLAGGFVYTYSAGSTTPLTTYKDNAGTANTNPIVLDAGGFATIYLSQNSYKFIVQNSATVQQWVQDNIQNFAQVIFTSANVWTASQTFQALINFLGSGSDTTAADGNVWYRTDLHRLRWYDSGAAAWHSIPPTDSPALTGTDSGVETLQNKTLNSPKIDRIVPTGSAPTIGVTGFGTAPTVTVEAGSSESFGSVLVTAGAAPAATGTVVYTLAGAAAPTMVSCIFQFANSTGVWTAPVTGIITATSTTGTTLTWTNGGATSLVNANAYRVIWMCHLK